MTTAYQPFPITEFKTGLYNYLQPWIRPADAFEPLVNAYVYRGVLQKRNGSTIFGNQLADAQPVMGIMQYQNESTGAISNVVASTQYLYLYTAGATPDGGTFSKITSVADSPFWSGTATGTITPNVLWNNISPAAATFKVYIKGVLTTTTTSNGAGAITAAGIIDAGSTINYTTGATSIVFVGTTSDVTLQITATLSSSSPYFSGTITNFFNWTNWQPTSSITSISTSYLYMTNNIDSVTLFDGTSMARPAFYVNSISTIRITKALDVKTYNNRLLLIRPTITGESNAANQDVYYSATFNPFDFVGVAGHGGAISAATGDQIISARFLRDVLVMAFSNSHWSFQISGIANPPFIFRRLNVSKSTKCPYAAISYDERVTNLGNTGFLACDGVNVQRFDIPIIDYYETQINQQYFNQDFSIRYDNLNQTWMFYPSRVVDNINPKVGNIAPGSDQVLIYNFLESTWATYKNSFPMTCMGLFNVTSGTTWAELNIEPNNLWQETPVPWNSYSTQTTSPLLLAGDTTGNIYHLDNAQAVRDGEEISTGELIATGNGGKPYSGTVKYIPVIAGSFTATDSIESFTDNGDGTLTGTAGGTGTINYTTGAWTLSFDANVTNGTRITATYNTTGKSFNVEIKTTRWNPFIGIGQKTQFGYVDVYYQIAYRSGGDPIQVTFNFFVDNNTNTEPSTKKTLSFDGPVNANYAWKRVYLNLIGEFVQIEIDPSEDAPFQILGFVLWARPAGRLTP